MTMRCRDKWNRCRPTLQHTNS